MKNIFKLTGVAALLMFSVGCSEEFLDKQPSEFLTTEQVGAAAEKNPDVTIGTMNGIYFQTFQTQTGGTTGHTDFGHKGYDIYGDMLSGDVALSVSTYGWYRADITEFQAPLDFTRNSNYQPWRYYYRIIRSTNTVIDALGGNDVVPENEENLYIMGQAKAMRAHSYFYLAQYFQKTYDPSEEILPIYTSLEDENGPKVPASEIYAQIDSDLNDAIAHLDGFNRTGKNQINQSVAQGIKAYVEGVKGNWQEVYDLTNDVITNGGYTLMSAEEVVRMSHDGPDTDPYGGGFGDLSTPGWMWGVDLTSDQELALVSWWGQMDLFTYSYAWAGDAKAIDEDLYNKIPEGDVRKAQFLAPTGIYEDLMPINKFYAPNRVVGGQDPVETDYVYMRVAEMYLLHAEAAAQLGNEAEAISTLKTLLDERMDDTSYVDGLSGQALLDEIYLQTRIELWGEGKSYLALKRNKATVVRGPNHLSFVGEPIPFDDERLTFEIPEQEIQANPAINTQNN
ncbi:glycan metabolism protein RagB [Salegentibacter salinarum]|uniref:Glycan metabolism protein RagB n=1 Tax=Salegentibacter salinarum TaxID=447422 RepID=A0A2N0TW87_9FLAO|nr:RagB/SusD family nutrient uptake outer membrane protein [Salegentibacter salinarum]PKD19004.1 glycan metabolism protein RagB [Salegentibacter salinarum]SKB96183.1 SusD family protein [Salegentibacter salinarum]